MKYNKLTAFLLTFATLISAFACNTMANSNFEFGSNKVNLQPSTYSLPVKMMKATNITSPSMANSCIKNATIDIGNDSKANVTIDLQAAAGYLNYIDSAPQG